jgi:hypothetical protein
MRLNCTSANSRHAYTSLSVADNRQTLLAFTPHFLDYMGMFRVEGIAEKRAVHGMRQVSSGQIPARQRATPLSNLYRLRFAPGPNSVRTLETTGD